MAITPIDSMTVAVDTYNDLKIVLENTTSSYTNITTVYLAADIQMGGGISIQPSRTIIAIDGKDPFDVTGNTIHTVTDYNSADQAYTIGVRSESSVHVTYRNINWTGNNFYGIFYTPEGTSYQNTSVTFDHIVYNGPQITFHPAGLTQIFDCTINIVQNYSGSPVHEVAEANHVELGGIITITQLVVPNTHAVFWIRGPAPSLTILPNAALTISTAMDVVYADQGSIAFTIGANASMIAEAMKGMFRTIGHSVSFALIDTGATFRLIQTTANGTKPTFNCAGAFTVNEGANVYMQANYAGGSYLINFTTASAALNLNNPKSFVLYNLGANAMNFPSRTAISMSAGQINYWTTVTPLINAGTLRDVPQYSWRKLDSSVALVSGTATQASTSLTGNFTPEELAGKPLSLLQLQSVRVFSVGNLPLNLEPITDDGFPVGGTTVPYAKVIVSHDASSFQGAADVAGDFSITTGVIPELTTVNVASNIPFLISTVVRAVVDAGEVTLLTPPETMPFLLSVIAVDPVVLYGRLEVGWTLQAFDSRIRSGKWYLYATIDGPLKSNENPAHTVPGALVFVNEFNTVQPMGAIPVLVYTGEDSGGIPKTTNVSWGSVKGILLQAVRTPYYNGETYRATITWTLSETEI